MEFQIPTAIRYRYYGGLNSASNAPAAKAATSAAPASVSSTPLQENFGDLPLVQSATQSGRKWTRVGDLTSSLENQDVWVRGRVHTTRGKGKCVFAILRQACYTVQGVLFASESISKDMIKYVQSLPKESVVDILATVTVPKQKIESTSQQVELQIKKFFCVNKSEPVLPFQIDDAARREDEEGTWVRVHQDTRLNNRCIDLRTPANHAIMRIQSAVAQLFREYMYSQGFTEIHTPKLISGASEGGASVFKLKYFERDACLAQSPQLYKQMAICSDFERVFEIGPVFRAEDSNTHRHLCEFTGLDMEMAIKEHYFEVLDVIENMFMHIFEGLTQRFASEIGVVNQQYPAEPFQFKRLRLTYEEGVKMLHELGVEMGFDEDLSTEKERILGAEVKKRYGTDFYILHRYPLNVRPFYTMPCADNPNATNSYDIFMRGEEIVSGAQRVHDPAFLEKRAKECGIPIASIQAYIDSFKYGAPPHGGCGVGLERVVMLFLGLNDIRKASMFPRDPKRLTP
eukprot:GILK01000568.1.p1 GENE.GILK01000568.1~~GILK01000568.1.p1  ORF type:complete len:514 (-),score=91.21 GILK01000568.1:171-1712(-)